MRVLGKCCAAIALHALVLPLAAQEDEGTDSIDLNDQVALDPLAVAVLPVEVLTTDPRGPSLAVEAYEAILARLASINGLYVIEQSLVQPYAGSNLSAEEIGRQLGVLSVLELSIQASYPGYYLHTSYTNAQTGRRSGNAGVSIELMDTNIQLPFDPDILFSYAVSDVVERVENELFPKPRPPDRQPSIAEKQAIFLDASLSDRERLSALRDLSPGRRGRTNRYRYIDGDAEILSGTVAIAAAQLALNSKDPDVRFEVWREMRGVGDPYLVQPLLHTLANDTDERVRSNAAKTLGDFLDEPGVREALMYAGDNDPSERVRNEIRYSMLSTDEQREELRATALDDSVAAQERWSAIYQFRRGEQETRELDEAMIEALVSIARNADEPQLRDVSWLQIVYLDSADVVQPLLEALESDPNERVRNTVANGLARFSEYPDVIEALEEAMVSDVSPLVRKSARESLALINR